MARSDKKSEVVNGLDVKELSKHGFSLLRDSTWAEVEDMLPTGLPEVDSQIGGGLPFGRIIELYSKPNVGKSTYAYQMTRMANQAGVQVVWMDLEATADRDHLAEVGIDPAKTLIWQPEEGDPTGTAIENVAEAIEEIVNYFVEQKQKVIVIWDSIGGSSSKTTLEKGYDAQQPGREAKAITLAMNKLQPLISSTKNMLIVINQVRDVIGGMGFGPQVDTPGGKALKHVASVRMQLNKYQDIKRHGDKFGHSIKFKLVKSKVSTPGSQGQAYLYGTYGMQELPNVLLTALDLGIIKKKSAGSKGMQIQLPTLDGEITEYNKDDLLDAVSTNPEIWVDTIRPIFNKVMLHYFPRYYSALDNKSLNIDDIPLYKDLREMYKQVDATPDENAKPELRPADMESEDTEEPVEETAETEE